MLGVYLAAAELTAKGFIVSPTSRSAIGAAWASAERPRVRPLFADLLREIGIELLNVLCRREAKDVRNRRGIYARPVGYDR